MPASRKAPAVAPRAPLSRHEWLLGGQRLLRKGGVRAVKLASLTAEVGATTGSFYHHFSDVAEYLTALAGYYGGEQFDEAMTEVGNPDAVERLRRFGRLTRVQNLQPLDRAMRSWAEADPRARAAVRRTDERVLAFLEGAFNELGFADRDAALRARLLFAYGTAHIVAGWAEQPSDLDDLLAILLGPDSATLLP
jgi:AcrR family transcriptional regulator